MDGTGKTTLARSLVEALQRRGISAVYVYGRVHPLGSRLVMAAGRKVFLRHNDPWQDYPGYAEAKRKPAANRLLRTVYVTAILADFCSQLLLKLARYAGRPRIVVVDRYVYDTVINDLAVHLSLSRQDVDEGIERLFQVLPRPAVTFFIDVDEATAFSRKDDVPDIEYLRERRPFYQALGGRPEVVTMDGEGSQQELAAEALTYLLRAGYVTVA